MMTNLFSVFDPSTGILSLNWLSTFMGLIIMPLMFWILPSRFTMMFMIIINKIYNELIILMPKKYKGMMIMFMSLFMMILLNNLFGLMPYIFTSSSHLVFSLSMALPLWVTLMVFGWMKKTNKMFSHLIPIGTPPILMPFMICIETISNIIRPISLAVRLTANMIAGHLLMSLLGNMTVSISMSMILIILIIQILLMLFETAVSFIQAYVFTILSTLYSSEI